MSTVSVETIAAHLGNLCERDGFSVVAIGGPGGAGKSTLSRLLLSAVPNAVGVEMDDFYRPSSERTQERHGLGESFDWRRLREQVFVPAALGHGFRYQRYSWDNDVMGEWVDVPAARLVIVEGIYAMRNELFDYSSFRIFVTAPRELRLQRGIERDGAGGRDHWLNQWMPEEDAYIAAQQPLQRADLVLEGTGGNEMTVVADRAGLTKFL